MASAVAKQIAACNRRARAQGLEGRLSVWEWRQTCTFFAERCVYCGSRQAWTIDHYWPLSSGGVTTQSNTVLACVVCNARKAEMLPIDEQLLVFVEPERLARIRGYLEEVGRRHQESLNRLWERELYLARAQHAVELLKQYCEEQALQGICQGISGDRRDGAYGHLRLRLFGVEWDPAYYFQVLVSLNWQWVHASGQELRCACEDARQYFDTALKQLNQKPDEGERALRLPALATLEDKEAMEEGLG